MLEIMSLAAVKTRDEQLKLSAPMQGRSAKRSAVLAARHQVGSGTEGWTGDTGMGGDVGAGAGSRGREDPGAAWVTPHHRQRWLWAGDRKGGELRKAPPERLRKTRTLQREGVRAPCRVPPPSGCLALMEGWLIKMEGDVADGCTWVEPWGQVLPFKTGRSRSQQSSSREFCNRKKQKWGFRAMGEVM